MQTSDNTFNPNWLKKQGIVATPIKLDQLSDILEEELEIRVGTSIAENLSDAQIAEFESLADIVTDAPINPVASDGTTGAQIDKSDESAQSEWLDHNYPDYKKAVTAQKAKLSRQVRAANDKPAFIESLQEA